MFGSEPMPHDENLLECFELRLKELKGEKPNRDYAPQLSDHQAAELVLEYIKKEKLVDFQLVGANGSYRCQKSYSKLFRKDVQWAHVSFTAKPRPENGDDSCNDDASEKLIFAEMFDYGQGVYFVKTYSVLDPHDSKITQGCSRCPSDGHHPHPSICEYFFGHGESDPTDNLRP